MKVIFSYLVIIITTILSCTTLVFAGDCGVEIKKINASNTDEMASFIYLDRRTDSEIMFFLSVNEAGSGANANKHSDIYYSNRRNLKSTDTYNNTWNYPSFMKWCKNDESQMRNLNLGPLALYANDMIIAMESQPSNGGYANSHSNNPNFDLYLVPYNTGALSCRIPMTTLNMDGFWDSHPAFSQDGNTLYFASDRPGGKGGIDIYCAVKSSDGTWGFPKNIESINSPGNDVSPHAGYDGLFYFSSDWDYEKNQPSKTGKNIHVARISATGEPVKPQNLDIFIRENTLCPSLCTAYNTPFDDMFPFVSQDKSYLYISSSDKNGKFNIKAFSLYKPNIALKVNCIDVVSDESGSYLSQNFKNEAAFFKVTDAFGKTTVHNSFETVYLEPDSRYKVEPDYNLDNCKNGEILGQKIFIINTMKPSGCDTLIEKQFSFKGAFRSTKLKVNSGCFIAGYWKPMNLENFNEFRSRASDGFFRDFTLVDKNYDDNDQAYKNEEEFTKLYVSLEKFVRDNYECLNFDGMKMRIVLNGFAFTSGIQNMIYPDADVVQKNFDIKKGEKFSDSQKGNIVLSRLRAYFTSQIIHNLMIQRSNYYKSIYAKGRIEYVIEGYGVSGAAFGTGDNKTLDVNNIDIFVDIAPSAWIANSERNENGKLVFKQQMIAQNEKQSLDNSGMITAENSIPPDAYKSSTVDKKDDKKAQEKVTATKPIDNTVSKKTDDKTVSSRPEDNTITKKPEEKKKSEVANTGKVKETVSKLTPDKVKETKASIKDTEKEKKVVVKEKKVVVKEKKSEVKEKKVVVKETKPEVKEKKIVVKEKKETKPKETTKKIALKDQPVNGKKSTTTKPKDVTLKGPKNTVASVEPVKTTDTKAVKEKKGKKKPVTETKVIAEKKIEPVKKTEVKKEELKAKYTLNNQLKDYENLVTDYKKTDKFSVNLGSYVRQSNCANLVSFLKNNGVVDLRIVPITKNNKTYYRVRIGYFDSLSEAKAKADEIKAIIRKAKIGAPVAVVQD